MKTKRKKRGSRWKLFIALIIIIVMLLGVYVGKKIFSYKISDLDHSSLYINDKLYNQISDNVAEEEYKKIRNIVLFGIDTQSKYDGQDEEGFIGRSDTIIILSFNTLKKKIKIISIPRDTYVEIDGHGKDKINYAYAFGGAQLAVNTINKNFDLNIKEYITIDFAGLVNIINDIGGIDLYITKEERNHINTFSYLPYEISGNERVVLTSYGNITLDGEQALAHSRNRTTGGDDFKRTERQREVLEAIMDKLLKQNVNQILNTMETFLKEVTTNINVGDYMGIISDVLLNKSSYFSDIVSAQVPTREYAKDAMIDGIYYFVVDDPELLKEKMLEYIYLQ